MSDKIVIVTTGGKKKVIDVSTLIAQAALPSEIPASLIVPDASHRFVTDSEKIAWANASTPVDITGKQDKRSGHSLVADTEIAKIHSPRSDDQDLSGLVVKESGKSLVADTEIAKIHTSGSDNQDLSNLVVKETGKGLSKNDFTDALKTSYDGAVTHAGSSHAPSNAQKNSDILKTEIEAVLTGELTSHSHASSGGLTQQQILRMI